MTIQPTSITSRNSGTQDSDTLDFRDRSSQDVPAPKPVDGLHGLLLVIQPDSTVSGFQSHDGALVQLDMRQTIYAPAAEELLENALNRASTVLPSSTMGALGPLFQRQEDLKEKLKKEDPSALVIGQLNPGSALGPVIGEGFFKRVHQTDDPRLVVAMSKNKDMAQLDTEADSMETLRELELPVARYYAHALFGNECGLLMEHVPDALLCKAGDPPGSSASQRFNHHTLQDLEDLLSTVKEHRLFLQDFQFLTKPDGHIVLIDTDVVTGSPVSRTTARAIEDFIVLARKNLKA